MEKILGVSCSKSFIEFNGGSFKQFVATLCDVAAKLEQRQDPSTARWREKGQAALTQTQGGDVGGPSWGKINARAHAARGARATFGTVDGFVGHDDSSHGFLTRSMAELLHM